jgi:lipoate---protein ligase
MPVEAYSADDELFEATREDGKTRWLLTRPDRPVVVLGRGSRVEVELFDERCRQDGVPILRRRGGGCAVVLDPGGLVVTVAQRAPGFGENRRHFKALSDWLIRGIARAGVNGVVQQGISDLCLGDRKVAGACLHRSRDTLLYSASLLIEPNLELVERYLQYPPREPDYRRGRSHRDFMGQLGSALGPNAVEKLEKAIGLTEF